MFSLFLLVCFLFPGLNGKVDKTRQQNALGSSVVQATVDLIKDNCIFPNDFLFLRRLAVAESRDGYASKTYRSGYNGGIWQVNENMFKQTLRCSSDVKLRPLCAKIQSALSIDWTKVKWSDLRKPLYSGIAASLYLQRSSVPTIPGDISNQSKFWVKHYNKHGKSNDFINSVGTLKEAFCNARPIDLVFSLDESGSIGSTNFQKMKDFVKQIIDKLPIGDGNFRIGLTKFQNSASTVFNLNSYSSKKAMKSAVDSTSYRAGGTNIASAIELMQNISFQTKHGARSEAAKIALLITDGRSNLRSTTTAAKQAHDAGIVIFALGIGSINKAELKAAASDPDCSHMLILSHFSYIDNLVYEIKKKACRAYSTVISGESDKEKEVVIPQNGTIEETIQVKPEAKTTYILVQVVGNGVVYLYQSSYTSHPSSAFYEIFYIASETHPIVMAVKKKDGRPFYLNYVGKMLNPLSKQKVHFTIDVGKTKPKAASVVCMEGKTKRECKPFDIKNSKFSSMMCSDSDALTLRNPCTAAALKSGLYYHRHASDPTKFIKCSQRGDMYITRCPYGKTYNDTVFDCLSSSEKSTMATAPSGKLIGQLVDPSVPNPCSRISGRQILNEYKPDNSKFIRCNTMGDAFVMQCQGSDVWHQSQLKCGKPKTTTTTTPPTTTTAVYNPCLKKSGEYFEFPGDKSKFIHCHYDRPFVKKCHTGTIWRQKTKTCGFP